MKQVVIIAIVLAAPIPLRATEEDAKSVAQKVLDQGAAQFDRRDPAAMAATYTADAHLLLISKDGSTGEIKVDEMNFSKIESLYRDLFKDRKEGTTSKNTVEFARFVTPEVMVIHGRFKMDVGKKGSFPNGIK